MNLACIQIQDNQLGVSAVFQALAYAREFVSGWSRQQKTLGQEFGKGPRQQHHASFAKGRFKTQRPLVCCNLLRMRNCHVILQMCDETEVEHNVTSLLCW